MVESMVLRFPAVFWIFVGVFFLVGVIADWNWSDQAFRGETESLSKFQFFLMICPIIGLGGVLMGTQVIRVTNDTIESRHLFIFRRAISRKSCRVRKHSSNGFVLENASGQTIRVHKLMAGAGDLHRLISNSESPG